jgi:hypothetical protein
VAHDHCFANNDSRKAAVRIEIPHFFDNGFPVIAGEQVNIGELELNAAFAQKFLGGFAVTTCAQRVDLHIFIFHIGLSLLVQSCQNLHTQGLYLPIVVDNLQVEWHNVMPKTDQATLNGEANNPRPSKITRYRLCCHSSSLPSSVKRGASRDPEVHEMTPFSWIPDLALLRTARPE